MNENELKRLDAIDDRLREIEKEVGVIKSEVENHIPSTIQEMKADLGGFRRQFWGGIALIIATGVGFNVWLVQQLLQLGVLR